MKTCTIICNLYSGKGMKLKELHNLVPLFEKYGYKPDIYITEYQGHAKEITKKLKYTDLVVSIGGDGTFNEVISGNFARKEQLVITHLPVGTTNDVGVMFGLSKNMRQNVISVLKGEIKQVDIGIINKHPFMYVAAFGMLVAVTYETPRKLKKAWGYLAYAYRAVKEIFKKPRVYEIEYTIDNIKYTGAYSLILVSNATRIAGFNDVHKDVKLNDDKLEIALFKKTKANDILSSVIKLKLDGIDKVPGIEFHRASNIKIKFLKEPKKHWSIDGEELLDDNKDINISVDKQIPMLLPKKNIDKLFINDKKED